MPSNRPEASCASAREQAIIALGNAVKRQALVMGYSDTFAVIGIVLIVAAVAILLTGKPKTAAAGGGHYGCRKKGALNGRAPARGGRYAAVPAKAGS